MKEIGEWGEFFPLELCLHGYNETVAQDYYPCTKEQILERKGNWRDKMPGVYGKETIKAQDLPDDIKDVQDSITKELVACANDLDNPGVASGSLGRPCGRNYRIIAQELSFYRRQGIALPRFCFDCRVEKRLDKQNPHELWHRQCMCEEEGHKHEGQCKNEFETTYAPERKEKVWCEECYNKEVL
jgi:hypothetical protein